MTNSQYFNRYDARNVSLRRKVKEGERRVAIDVRVSTQHEMQINALENQKQWALDLARDHEDWVFDPDTDLYIEEGLSGTSYKKRPQFAEMINKAKAGKYDLIVVREVCRLMRNAKLTLTLVDELLDFGVEVYFVNDGIWTRNEDDYFKLTIMAQYAEQESRKISERVFSGQAIARENGILMGNGNILGYDLIKGKKSSETTYVINEEQAETVRKIYDLALHGMGVKKIRYYLEEHGYKTAEGNTHWYESSIERILRRSTYMGVLEHFQSVIENPLTHQRVKVSKDKHLMVEVKIPCIIEADMWHKVQKEIDSRVCDYWVEGGKKAAVYGARSHKDVYCRKMRCGCGRRFRRDFETDNHTCTYRCYQLVDDGSQAKRLERSLSLKDNCSVYGIRDWKMNFFTLRVFNYLDLNSEEIKSDLLRIIENSYVSSSGCEYSKTDLPKIDKDIRKVQSRNEKLLDFLEEGLIDKDTYIKRKEKNDKEIQQKEELKKCIVEEQMEEVQKEEVIASVKKFIDEALKFPKIHNVKVAVPDALIDTYVNSIKVCAGGIFEYNIKINPNAEVDVPVVPYDIFNPQIHSAYNILDNSKATLIAEFTINYEEAKAYANSLGRKVRRVHFSEDVTIRIFTNL